jgi:hypothetical protein
MMKNFSMLKFQMKFFIIRNKKICQRGCFTKCREGKKKCLKKR